MIGRRYTYSTRNIASKYCDRKTQISTPSHIAISNVAIFIIVNFEAQPQTIDL